MNKIRKPCLFPWTHLYYHNNGSVYPCCKLAGVDKFKLGDTTDSIESLWNSDVQKQMRLDIINQTEPSECYYHCFNNINPLHLYLHKEYREQQDDFFKQTQTDGTHQPNFVIWNINESNICNFKCIYCCSDFSNQFDKKNVRKSFNNLEEMLSVFEANINTVEKLYLSSGEPFMQKGYYKMLEILIKHSRTDLEINIHSNFSGYQFGGYNFFDMLNKFNNVTLFASLDSHGARAEYIREGTVWKDIEDNRVLLQNYTNVKFAAQAVITNLNLWSLPDFHMDWFNRGLLKKDNIRYFCLTSPEELHISVLSDKMKDKIITKYVTYLNFLKDEDSQTLNCMTPYNKIEQIIEEMKKPSIVPLGRLDYFLLKQNIKKLTSFKDVFPEFVI